MNRAAVWFCWGRDYIAEAAESARSAAPLKIDRMLITDAEGAADARKLGLFSPIVVMQPVYGNILDKSRLIDLLPGGYDAYLFLDTDTLILDDVSLGFAKAERHGIAMAPAPNYNLCTFICSPDAGVKPIASVMPRLGLEPADQLQFNTGVIFFCLTPRVRQVFERWRDICRDVAAPANLLNDQPFLSLAMEQLDFVPYALSPLYNYRGRGELAVGPIRIWHSHHRPPPDVNVFERAWPGRRFIRGERAPDEDPLG